MRRLRQSPECGSRLARLAVAILGLTVLTGSAAAQGRLEAQYTMTLAGLPIGKGTWVIDISDSQYSSVFEKLGSTSKITPRNGYTRWRTTWPIVNLASRVLMAANLHPSF